jgi:hypothetical protein
MKMLLNQRNYLPQYYNRDEHGSFEEYLNGESENLRDFLRLTAEDPRHPIRCGLDWAGKDEIEAELQRWLDRQVCNFRRSMRHEHRECRLRRKLRRTTRCCIRLEAENDQLREDKAQLEQAVEELSVRLQNEAVRREVFETPRLCGCGWQSYEVICTRCGTRLN